MMKKEYIFSSANLCFLLFWLALCNGYFSFLFFTKIGLEVMSIIGALLSNIFFVCKYKLFIDKPKNKVFTAECIYQKNTSAIENFIICMLNSGFSNCISMFSGFKLTVLKANNKVEHDITAVNCNNSLKTIESCIGVMFLIVGFLLSKIISNFSISYGIVIFFVALIIGNKNKILKKIFSVNYSKIDGYNVKLMLPLGSFSEKATNKLGLAGVRENTIYIDVDLINKDESVVKYVIEHEKAHIANLKQNYMFKKIIDEVFSFLAIILPFVLYNTTKGNIYWIPPIIYVGYVLLTSSNRKKTELKADLVASENIGVDNCINALKLLKGNVNTYRGGLFQPSIDERINNLKGI